MDAGRRENLLPGFSSCCDSKSILFFFPRPNVNDRFESIDGRRGFSAAYESFILLGGYFLGRGESLSCFFMTDPDLPNSRSPNPLRVLDLL
jgi:hypothetical protein